MSLLGRIFEGLGGGEASQAPMQPPASPPPPAAAPGGAEAAYSGTGGLLTAEVLLALGVHEDRIGSVLPALASACAADGITSRLGLAAFLANAAWESGWFTRRAESLNYSPAGLMGQFGDRISWEQANRLGALRQGKTVLRPADEEGIANLVYGGEWGVSRLGNTAPGDGWACRGSGFIQVTGRFAHAALAAKVGMAMEDFGQWARNTDAGAARSATLWWVWKKMPLLAETGDIVAIRRRVNGGTNGLHEVAGLYAKARAALGMLP